MKDLFEAALARAVLFGGGAAFLWFIGMPWIAIPPFSQIGFEDIFGTPAVRQVDPTDVNEPTLVPTFDADPAEDEFPAVGCVDVTSLDHDWGNDMRCTDVDGTVFYTDYAGAQEFEASR